MLASAHGSLRLQCVFKKSTIIVYALEIEAAKLPDAADSGYITADWNHPLRMQVIDKQTDVFGDGKIVLIPLPECSQSEQPKRSRGESSAASGINSVGIIAHRTSPRSDVIPSVKAAFLSV